MAWGRASLDMKGIWLGLQDFRYNSYTQELCCHDCVVPRLDLPSADSEGKTFDFQEMAKAAKDSIEAWPNPDRTDVQQKVVSTARFVESVNEVTEAMV